MDYHSTALKLGLLVTTGGVIIGYLSWPLIARSGKRKPQKRKMGFQGLYNPRNWCFINSAVQALSSTENFINWLKSQERDLESMPASRNLLELLDCLKQPVNSYKYDTPN